MRSPKWTRDELILALDLYFKLKPVQIHARNPLIIELSETLNQLPIHDTRAGFEKFRNPNGVGLKLSNFLFLDHKYEGKGMASVCKLVIKVFTKFKNGFELLANAAQAIKSLVLYPEIKDEIFLIKEDIEEEEFEKKKGAILYRYHLSPERNSSLVKKKKRASNENTW